MGRFVYKRVNVEISRAGAHMPHVYEILWRTNRGEYRKATEFEDMDEAEDYAKDVIDSGELSRRI